MKSNLVLGRHIKKFLFATFILLHFFNANSQTTTNLLTNPSNVWYEKGGFGFWPLNTQSIHKKFYFNGDTIINSNLYNKLYVHQIDTLFEYDFGSEIPISFTVYSGTFYGVSFRQDSTKVYFVLKDSTSESLYCDFNMVIGDTLKYINNGNNSIVDSILTHNFNSEIIREFKLDNGWSFYESIGNELGLFKGFGIGIEGGVYLNCFEQDGITFPEDLGFGNPTNCGAGFITNANENSKYRFETSIFPNPNDGHFNLNINKLGTYQLKVYNAIGQLVLQNAVEMGNTEINLIAKGVSAGLYFVEISNEQQQRLKIEKIVVRND